MPILRRNSGIKKFFIGLLVLLIVGIIFMRSVIYPVFFRLAEARVYHLGNRVISEVIEQEIEDLNYRDLISYELNDRGDIILMQPNVREINRLASRITIEVQKRFQPRLTIRVPVLRLLGLDMLAGMGPDIPIRIIPVGYVSPPEIIDSFEEAGINQTRHKLYLKTSMKFQLAAPLARKDLQITADVPIIEATILGKVPEVYINFDGDFQGGGILE